jgi:hypothetical protein
MNGDRIGRVVSFDDCAWERSPHIERRLRIRSSINEPWLIENSPKAMAFQPGLLHAAPERPI